MDLLKFVMELGIQYYFVLCGMLQFLIGYDFWLEIVLIKILEKLKLIDTILYLYNKYLIFIMYNPH